MPASVDDERTPLLAKSSIAPPGPSRPTHLPPRQTHLAKCFGALGAGKLPSQAQVSTVLAEAVRWEVTDVDNPPEGTKRSGKVLSESGRRVVGDARTLLLELKQFGETKNVDDKFQDFWYHSRRSHIGFAADVTTPASKRELTEDYHRLLKSSAIITRVFLTSAITTSPATLLNDALLVARDILADAAESVSQPVGEVAATLRPTEEERKGAGGLDDEMKKGKEVVGRVLGGPDAEGTIPERAKKVIAQDVEDQAVERFRMLVERMQDDPAFEPAFITLIDLAYKYTTQTSSATSSTLSSVSLSDPTEHTRSALHSLRLIVESLSNRSLDPLSEALDGAVKAITADPELTAYFKQLDEHVRRVLTDRPFARSIAATRRTQEIYRQGQELLKIKPEWKQAAAKLLVELQQVIVGILQDERVNGLAGAVGKIIQDTIGMGYVLTGVAKGNAIAVWRDITDVILPAVMRVVKRIPMPRFEFDSPDVAFVLDDVIFESANFLPDHFGFTTSNDVEVSAAPDEPTRFDSMMRIRFDGLRLDIHDAPFWVSIKKYAWFPPLREQYGIIDFSVLGSGLGMDVEIRFPADLPTGIFTVENVVVRVDKLDFNIRGSKYPWLMWLLGPFLRMALKLGLKLVLQQYIKYGLTRLDQWIWVYQQRKQEWQDLGMEPQEAATNAVVIGKPGDAPHAEPETEEDKKSILDGVEFSGRGIIKRNEEGDTAIAVGAEQILPGVGGPPSKWGRSSVARRVAMVEEDVQGQVDDLEYTVEEARDITREAVTAVDKVDIQSMAAVAADERREEVEEDGWKSDVFDIMPSDDL
ncbi:hypothetical protein CALVIDRAFT_603185 [Calocera viscosa TUFC12733]|uniref:HAM1-like N-terminal domain-containing protein n=1 Tax=Calocera viscosa (strain TUFC12733) TaxID=1330018 RepID=A0A167G3Q9_CALVF|nr:hypothetical protein CALVIDRAFT_603185 [Calocera viscosa TUFC12733]